MLKIQNLKKKYGNRSILTIQDLYIDKGISHLKGINGSGKTTFSKIIAGLTPFEGEITLFDQYNPNKTRIAYRKLVSFAESEPNYPEFLTANDLISFVGKAKGAPNDQLKTLVETFGISEYMFDHVGTYSSGMLKRLSICLAFLGNPSLILLDEPFNTLDSSAIEILQSRIEALNSQGVNFILVSHQDIGKLGMSVHSSYLVKDHTIKAE